MSCGLSIMNIFSDNRTTLCYPSLSYWRAMPFVCHFHSTPPGHPFSVKKKRSCKMDEIPPRHWFLECQMDKLLQMVSTEETDPGPCIVRQSFVGNNCFDWYVWVCEIVFEILNLISVTTWFLTLRDIVVIGRSMRFWWSCGVECGVANPNIICWL